eukprot:g3122.t1
MAGLREPDRRPDISNGVKVDDWNSQSFNSVPPRGPVNRTSQTRSEPEFTGFTSFTKSVIVGAFVLGIGAGVYFTSEVNLEPSNVASSELVDRRTPNSEVCMENGYSSMVFDQRLFVSFNP